MTLAQRIDSDLKDAMRAKDVTKLGVLRMLKSALKYSAIEKSGATGELDEAEATQVIRKQVKQRQDSIESFEKGGRAELADKEESEAELIGGYLPAELSDAELTALVAEKVEQTGAASPKDMGKVMGAVMPAVGGRADGKRVSALVREKLSA